MGLLHYISLKQLRELDPCPLWFSGEHGTCPELWTWPRGEINKASEHPHNCWDCEVQSL